MADNAWNARVIGNKNMDSGVKVWTLEVATHLDFPESERADIKSAATTSQSAFDTAIANSSLGSAQKSWYDGLPALQKGHFREAAQLLP